VFVTKKESCKRGALAVASDLMINCRCLGLGKVQENLWQFNAKKFTSQKLHIRPVGLLHAD